MATITLLAPQTDAVTTAIPFDTGAYAAVVVTADALASAETATIYQAITPPGGTTVYVPAVTTIGTAASLTATLPACILPGGPTYALIKDETAGECGVYLSPVGRANG